MAQEVFRVEQEIVRILNHNMEVKVAREYIRKRRDVTNVTVQLTESGAIGVHTENAQKHVVVDEKNEKDLALILLVNMVAEHV
jgi:hypothetical protein